MAVCQRCASPNDPQLRYCAVCGTTLRKPEKPTDPEGRRLIEVSPPGGASPETLGSTMTSRPISAQSPPSASLASPAAPSPRHCWKCRAGVPSEAIYCQACGSDQRQAPAVAPGVATHIRPPAARLVVIAQDGTPGRGYPIQGGQIDIGKTEGGVRLSNDTYVCPKHARIQWKNGRFWALDLGSVNGIFARLTSVEPLAHGDLVLMGLEVLRFELVRTEEQAQSQAIERDTHVFGSPATPRYARMVQRTVEGISRNVFYLSKSQITLGRETGDIVFTDDPFMSRKHASVNRNPDGSFVLSDLGSSNGTFIGIRDERPLTDGDHVRIGQHLFRLEMDEPV